MDPRRRSKSFDDKRPMPFQGLLGDDHDEAQTKRGRSESARSENEVVDRIGELGMINKRRLGSSATCGLYR